MASAFAIIFIDEPYLANIFVGDKDILIKMKNQSFHLLRSTSILLVLSNYCIKIKVLINLNGWATL